MINYPNRIEDKHVRDKLNEIIDHLNKLITQPSTPTPSTAAPAVPAAAAAIAAIQQALSVGGSNPLNVTGLQGGVPSGGNAVFENAPLTNAVLVLGASGAKIQTLGTQGTDHVVLHGATTGGVFPTFSAVDLTLDVSGILPIANGGTNAASAGAALTNLGAAASGGVGANTVTLAKLTTLGTNGSLTWNADGCITSFVAPT
jgi:hypothetical protein